MNPTDTSYEFVWEPLYVPVGQQQLWKCVTQRGVILSGKRYEMCFEYTPKTMGLHEAFWRFSIPQRNLTAVFLLVGNVVEPRVLLDTSRLQFDQVLVGSQSTEFVNLVNQEHIPFSFSFDLKGDEKQEDKQQSAVDIQPSQGVVPPNGNVRVAVTYAPRSEKSHNINLMCAIRNKAKPLALNVKGEGYAVHDSLRLIEASSEGFESIVPLSSDSENRVEFGNVTVNASASKYVVLENTGRVKYDFVWSRSKNETVRMEPSHGSVQPGQQLRCRLTFSPSSECRLKAMPLTCTIAGSRTYRCILTGRGSLADLNFSFTQHDFGCCFVSSAAKPMKKTTTLRITNREMSKNVTLDCLFERRPHLQVQFNPVILKPQESVDVPIMFSPSEARVYSDVITFEVNSLYEVKLFVKGEGTNLDVGLLDASADSVTFGAITSGVEVMRSVWLLNRSKIPANFQLVQSVDESGSGNLSRHAVSFWPDSQHTLRPNERVKVDLRFQPSQRVEAFSESLKILTEDGRKRNLLSVSGACLSAEVRLDTSSLNFGVVTVGSSVTRKVRLLNAGDVGSKFEWTEAAMKPHFEISPVRGFVPPHADVVFEVTFHPQVEKPQEIRCETSRYFVQESETLRLVLCGECVESPASKQMSFETKVRETSKNTIRMANPSKDDWHVRSVFRNRFFSGKDVCHIPAGQTVDYEVSYTPLTMTKKEKHQGSVFFAMPNGTTVSYDLVGTSLPPSVETLPKDTVTKTSCKQALTVLLPVRNWLNSLQRFSVRIDVDESTKRDTTFLRGPVTIVVPELMTRQYKLNYTAWTPGETKARVTFTNENTGEYMFYNVVLSSSEAEPGSAGMIKMNSTCRNVVREMLSIETPISTKDLENDLPKKWWSCDDDSVRVKRTKSEESMEFEVSYRPLLPHKRTRKVLELNLGPKLGLFKYTLDLESQENSEIRTIPFKISLGSLSKRKFRFRSFCSESTTYRCELASSSAFTVPTQVVAPACNDFESGVEVVLDISFEPERLGDFSETLLVVSEKGGTYRCQLRGVCTPPMPRGPLNVQSGNSTSIVFKNVFNTSRTLNCFVDNNDFTVSPACKEVAAKSQVTFNVSYSGGSTGDEASSSSSSSGKLFISSSSNKDGEDEVAPWVYYVNGSSSSGKK